MRGRLLDAAVECLAEVGYARTTTVEVSRRAGVSRGAQLHYFPSRADLLTAAVGHVLDRRIEEFRKVMADAEPGADRLDTAIDVLWSMWSGPTFTAWLELRVAARTDPALAEALAEVERGFATTSLDVFTELFPFGADSPLPAELALTFTFTLMDGRALHALVQSEGPTGPDRVIELLKQVARLALPSERT
ncbi:MAG TPA: TetR family transcriptional regulator [Acidimicrobiales bacterium]|nr:TetR family transcriptional regulator [Acidimicrobiales bacterium]